MGVDFYARMDLCRDVADMCSLNQKTKIYSHSRLAPQSIVSEELCSGPVEEGKHFSKEETLSCAESLESSSNNDSLNFLGSFVNLCNLCISEETFDWELLRVAIATQNLYGSF